MNTDILTTLELCSFSVAQLQAFERVQQGTELLLTPVHSDRLSHYYLVNAEVLSFAAFPRDHIDTFHSDRLSKRPP